MNDLPEQILPEVHCDYCKNLATLVSGERIYGNAFRERSFWLCEPCDAYVGVHPNANYKPVGRFADQKLRHARKEANAWFDKVARFIMNRDDIDFGYARAKGYGWLAEVLLIHKSDCHVLKFDESRCWQAVKACRNYMEQMKGSAT